MLTGILTGFKKIPTALNRGQGSYSQGDADEAEYDRLRALARQEQDRRHELIAQSRAAYDQGDGAAAKQLSNEAKKHDANSDNVRKYNVLVETLLGGHTTNRGALIFAPTILV